jgi:hypothetical protein
MNFEPKSLHNDRRFRARLATIVGSGIRQGHLSPVIPQPHGPQAELRRFRPLAISATNPEHWDRTDPTLNVWDADTGRFQQQHRPVPRVGEATVLHDRGLLAVMSVDDELASRSMELGRYNAVLVDAA